jgi:hypothetical protein
LSLDGCEAPDRLYLARGAEVSPCRPLFTGDVLEDIAIPGVQEHGAAMVIAHPCGMRGRQAQLLERILFAAVTPHDPVPGHKWSEGFYDRMPLPELRGPGEEFAAAWLDRLGRAARDDVLGSDRIACLSPVGVNMVQQRLVFHMTRVEVPTSIFWEAFAHTYEEADLLEEWTEDLGDLLSPRDAAAEFELWIRDESRQERLRDPRQRGPVRADLRAEIRRRNAS